MKDDLEGKTLEELKELEAQLTHQIDVIDQMRIRLGYSERLHPIDS